jgi:peptidoglycan/xylan/chitin deacetylase (PgdA/CDA1 family)
MKPTVSLTFDDGLACQLDAVKELNLRNLKATFFLATGCPEYPWDLKTWQEVSKNGHEIGSHSVSHEKAASMRDPGFETLHSKRTLELHFDRSVKSYCYAYTDAPSFLQEAARKAGYSQARGGRVARPDKYYVRGDRPNLMNVTCFHVGPETVKDSGVWAKETVRRNAWLTLMFHGTGDPQAWDNISLDQFKKLLDDFQGAGVDIKTFADGADVYRRG